MKNYARLFASHEIENQKKKKQNYYKRTENEDEKEKKNDQMKCRSKIEKIKHQSRNVWKILNNCAYEIFIEDFNACFKIIKNKSTCAHVLFFDLNSMNRILIGNCVG